MNSIKKIYLYALTLALLSFTACSEDLEQAGESNSGTIHFTAVIGNANTTRSLSDDDTDKISFNWEQGEEVALIYTVDDTPYGAIATVKQVMDDDRALLEADLTGNPTTGTAVKLIYPASAAAGPSGELVDNLVLEHTCDLEHISAKTDVATADATLVIRKNNLASLAEPTTLSHKYALLKFTLEDEEGNSLKVRELYASDYNDDELWIADNYEARGVNPIYVVMEPYEGPIYFTVTTTSGDTYTSAKTADIKAGKFYHPMLKMHKRVEPTNIGDPFYSDGTWGDQPHRPGAVVIGVVAYYNADEAVILDEGGNRSYHGLVMALKDAEHPTTANFINPPANIQNSYDDRYDFMWGSYHSICGLRETNRLNHYYNMGVTANNMAGKRNTAILQSHYDDEATNQSYGNSADYQAVNACTTYKPEGLPVGASAGRKGSWHFASAGEWILALNAMGEERAFGVTSGVGWEYTASGQEYIQKINDKLTAVGGTPLATTSDMRYLTSTLWSEGDGTHYIISVQYVEEEADNGKNGFVFNTSSKNSYPRPNGNPISLATIIANTTGYRVRPFLAF